MPAWFPDAGEVLILGHTHYPLIERTARGGLLLNPGSVGQPRDSDRRAAYMVLDTEAGTVTWRRVDYAIDRAQRAIMEAGLPPTLALRLAEGR